MQVAGSLGIPVMFHDGTPPDSTPRQIGWLAERYPQTSIILGHSGLADLWRDAADVAHLCQNVWLQTTASPPLTIRAALAAAGPDRVLFGTDGGFRTTGFMRYAIARFRAALGEEVLERAMVSIPQRLRALRRG